MPDPIDWNAFDEQQRRAAGQVAMRAMQQAWADLNQPVAQQAIERAPEPARARDRRARRQARPQPQPVVDNGPEVPQWFICGPVDHSFVITKDGAPLAYGQYLERSQQIYAEAVDFARQRDRNLVRARDRLLSAEIRQIASREADRFDRMREETLQRRARYNDEHRGLFTRLWRDHKWEVEGRWQAQWASPPLAEVDEEDDPPNFDPFEPPPPVPPASQKNYLPVCKRGEATPRFFIDYETLDEWRLRLRGTYILYKGSPIFINEIVGGGRQNHPSSLLVTDVDGSRLEIRLDEENLPHLDARSFQPGYIDATGLGYRHPVAGYLFRTPGRVYRQGVCSENTRVQTPYGEVSMGGFDILRFLKALATRTTEVPLSAKVLNDLRRTRHNGLDIPSLPLSVNFAVVCTAVGTEIYHRGVSIAASTDAVPSFNLKNRLPGFLHEELGRLNLAA